MTATAISPKISANQYAALQTALPLPTPGQLFDFQLLTLKEKGFEVSSEESFQLRNLIPETPQLFLVIPPKPETLDLEHLVSLITVSGKEGETLLEQDDVTDLSPVPTKAHLLLKIEDGRKYRGIKATIASKDIRQRGRIAYSVWYGLIHCILFPCVLENHFLDLCGSEVGSSYTPCISLDQNGVACLGDRVPDHTHAKCGAPSAEKMLDF